MPWHNGQLRSLHPAIEAAKCAQQQRDLDADRAAIEATGRKEDERYDRQQRELSAHREAERRERAETEVAAMRADIERDLRLSGAPTADIGRLADEAVRRYFTERARTVAAMPSVEQTRDELRNIRRGRGRVDVSAA